MPFKVIEKIRTTLSEKVTSNFFILDSKLGVTMSVQNKSVQNICEEMEKLISLRGKKSNQLEYS